MSLKVVIRSIAVFCVCVALPSLCWAGTAFQSSGSVGTCNGTQIRLKFYGAAYLPGTLTLGPWEYVATTGPYNPSSQYNYMGTYYYGYNWTNSIAASATTYNAGEVRVECLINGGWMPYSTMNCAYTHVP